LSLELIADFLDASHDLGFEFLEVIVDRDDVNNNDSGDNDKWNVHDFLSK